MLKSSRGISMKNSKDFLGKIITIQIDAHSEAHILTGNP